MKIIYFIVTVLITCGVSAFTSNIISQSVNGGRLGDHLMTYVRAKMLSDKYKIPFFLKPFAYVELLMMSKYEQELTPAMETRKRAVKVILSVDPTYNNTHFICYPYLDGQQDDITIDELYDYIMRNSEFARKIRKMIAPVYPIHPLIIPENKVTIAMHVRKRSGTDKILQATEGPVMGKNCYDNVANPEKFPEDSYYIEQMKLLSNLLGDCPLFVYIFTDDSNPIALMNYYKECINKDNIEFDCRSDTNNGTTFIIEDLFAMAYQFDCLIRGKSAFAYIAQLIDNHKIVVHTKGGRWVDGTGVVIEQVGMILRDTFNNIQRVSFDSGNYDIIKQNLMFCELLNSKFYYREEMA